MEKKTLPKWAKITIIVVCSLVGVFVLGMGAFHVGMHLSWLQLEVAVDEMETENISISQYNETNGTKLYHFDNSENSIARYLDGKIIGISENSTVNGQDVKILVLFCDNTYNYRFSAFDEFDAKSTDFTSHTFEETQVSVTVFNGKTYVHFVAQNYEYKLVINSTETNAWQDVLSELFA